MAFEECMELLKGMHHSISEEEARMLFHFADSIAHYQKTPLCVELGTYEGWSSIMTAFALKGNGRVVSIEIDEEMAGIARQNVERVGFNGIIDIMHADCNDYVSNFSDNTINLLFIDASHLYSDVTKSLNLYLPKVASSVLSTVTNIICGHDYNCTNSDGVNVMHAVNDWIDGNKHELLGIHVNNWLWWTVKR